MSAEVSHSEPCPKCQEQGMDNKGNNRVVYVDGGYFCFLCKDYKNGTSSKLNTTTIEYTQLPMYTTESVLAKRNISSKVIQKYGISSVVDNDSTQLLIKFPVCDVNGSQANFQYRGVDTKEGTLTKEIRFSKGKIKLPLMGWQLINSLTKTVIICEGLTDALCLATVLEKDLSVVVLGMTSVSTVKKAASHILAYNGDYRVVLAFDNDEPGVLAKNEFVHSIETHDEDLTIYTYPIPQEYKDLSDWVRDCGKEPALAAFDDIRPVSLTGIIGNQEIADQVIAYFDDMMSNQAIELSFSPTLSKASRLMPGKLGAVIGASGEGKSTFVEHIALEFLQQKRKVFFVSQEMSPAEVSIKMLRMIRNQPLDDPKFIKTIDAAEKKKIHGEVLTLAQHLNMTDGFGVMSVDNIDKHIHKLTSVGRHPDLVIIDHLLAISNDTEKETILETCRELKAMARAHNTLIIILTHTSKPQGKQRGINQPTLNAAYGSSGIPIYCDFAWGVASDKQVNQTAVETVKLDRLGGSYANVYFDFSDYCFSELEKKQNTKYDNTEDNENISEETYY